MRFPLPIGIAAIWLLSAPLVHGQSITIDSIGGLHNGNPSEIVADGATDIAFYIRFVGDGDTHGGISNGFRVFSGDGASWTSTQGDTLGIGKAQFDGGFFINPFSVTGSGADTLGFSAFRFFGSGLPAGYDDVAYVIQIGPIDASHHGKTICIDSSWYPPSGLWKWSGVDVVPNWDGPHCFTCKDPTATGVGESDNALIPDGYSLSQNYPNPFNPATSITFQLPKSSHVELSIYNVLGKEIVRLIDETLPTGVHRISWNGITHEGKSAPAGLYLYQLKTKERTLQKRMLLLK
jgi:hypothetical protein